MIAIPMLIPPCFDGIPDLSRLLSDADRAAYISLKHAVHSLARVPVRNNRVEAFNEALDIVRDFAVRGDASDWKRCMVCGIFWLQDGLAVNMRRLRVLIPRCKSTINHSLRLMGFTEALPRVESARDLKAVLPSSIDFTDELRNWTVRARGAIPALEPIEIRDIYRMFVQSRS
jgi:hypothetical protein